MASGPRAEGNAAFGRGDYDAAAALYAEALAARPTSEERRAILSNRSAAHLGAGRFDAALADADGAVACDPSWPKAHARRGAALASLGRHAEAVHAFLDAEDRGAATSPERRASLIRSALLCCRGLRKPPAGSLARRRGQRYAPGDIAADADAGALDALARGCTARDVWVRYACLVQLPTLAACPEHKLRFLDGNDVAGSSAMRAVRALAEAPPEELDASFPPRRSLESAAPGAGLAAACARAIGAPSYEHAHPKCIVARFLAALVEHANACAGAPPSGGPIMAAVLWHPAHIVRCASRLAGDTSACAASQRHLGAALGALARYVCGCVGGGANGRPPAAERAVGEGMLEALEKLGRAAREQAREAEAAALGRMLWDLKRHPDLPENQVPQE